MSTPAEMKAERVRLIKNIAKLKADKFVATNWQLVADKFRRIRDINGKIGKTSSKAPGNRPADLELMNKYPPIRIPPSQTPAASASGETARPPEPGVARSDLIHEVTMMTERLEQVTVDDTREATRLETNRVVVDNMTGATVEDQTIREETKTESHKENHRSQMTRLYSEMVTSRKTLVAETLNMEIPPDKLTINNQGLFHMFKTFIGEALRTSSNFDLPFRAIGSEEFVREFRRDVKLAADFQKTVRCMYPHLFFH
jgi:hypothetical protein